MRTSEQIQELAAALAKAQAQIEGAKKDSLNPHFRAKYADLASVWDACRDPLASNGLSVLQSPRLVANGEVWTVEIETILMHASGQWMADVLAVPVAKLDAQGVGSSVTYGRRYALSAFVGVAPEEDDGEAAVGRAPAASTMHTVQKPTAKPNGKAKTPEAKELHEAADKAKAASDSRTPDEVYQAGRKMILEAKTTAKCLQIRGGVEQYAAEGRIDADQASTLLRLLDHREEELEVVEPAAT